MTKHSILELAAAYGAACERLAEQASAYAQTRSALDRDRWHDAGTKRSIAWEALESAVSSLSKDR